MSDNLEKFIKLGECARPHGIKGEFSFHLYNTEDSCLEYIKEILIRPLNSKSSLPKEGAVYKIKKININKKTITTLDGVDNRNMTEEMIPFEIFVDRSQLKDTEEGEYYLNDIIGLKVLNPEGEELGVVESFYENGAQEVLVIKGKNEMIEVPFVDDFILEKNFKSGFIKIRPIEFI